jgi:hypothetical protein
VIDVRAQRIIPFDEAPQYAALSYVWGDCEQYMLLRKNLDQLGTSGALAYLPSSRVIKDAMTACTRLDIPYLWVDSMCICQDDPEMKHGQLAMMGVIYSEAYLTLVDGRGTSANDVGLSRVSTPSSQMGRHIVIDGTKYHVIGAPDSAIDRSKWRTRGWTLQETMLSKRMLVFLETDCFLMCPDGMQAESSTTIERHFDNGHGHIANICHSSTEFN